MKKLRKKVAEIINDGLNNVQGHVWTHSSLLKYNVAANLAELVIQNAVAPEVKALKKEIQKLKQEKMRLLLEADR